MSVEEAVELSAVLEEAKAAIYELAEYLNDTAFRQAFRCAVNAAQAVAACEEELKKGLSPESD